jgi:hypothetical protein
LNGKNSVDQNHGGSFDISPESGEGALALVGRVCKLLGYEEPSSAVKEEIAKKAIFQKETKNNLLSFWKKGFDYNIRFIVD